MLVDIVWFFVVIVISVNGKCTNRTCEFGRCLADKCLCAPGITGTTCNIDIVDCDRASCLNNGTCVEAVNGFLCDCLPNFEGARCQFRSCPSKSSDSSCRETQTVVHNCTILKFPIGQNEAACIAVDAASPVDFQCQCEYRKEDKRWLRCQMIPSISSREKCVFQKLISPSSSSTFSSLPDPITVHVCPIGWHKLQPYRLGQELANHPQIEECHLLKN